MAQEWMKVGVQEEGPGPGTKCLELNPSRATQSTGGNTAIGQAHARGCLPG